MARVSSAVNGDIPLSFAEADTEGTKEYAIINAAAREIVKSRGRRRMGRVRSMDVPLWAKRVKWNFIGLFIPAFLGGTDGCVGVMIDHVLFRSRAFDRYGFFLSTPQRKAHPILCGSKFPEEAPGEED